MFRLTLLVAGGEPLEASLGPVAHQDGHTVVLFQVEQVRGESLEIRPDGGCLLVGVVGLQIVTEHPLPIALNGIVDGVPVPVAHSIRAGGQMAEGLEPELAGVGEPAEVALGLGLQNQIIGLALQPPGQGAAKGDLRPGEAVLAVVVDVTAGDGDRLCRPELIHIGLEAEGEAPPLEVEVVGDELVRPPVFVHDLPLPLEKFGDKLPLEGLIGGAVAAVDGAPDVGEILPAAQAVGPVGKAHGLVQRFHRAVLRLEPLFEERLGPGRAGVIGLGLVVQLEADDAGIALHRLHQPPDDPLRVKAVARVGEVKILPGAVAARACVGV